jgi:hypothetical protein
VYGCVAEMVCGYMCVSIFLCVCCMCLKVSCVSYAECSALQEHVVCFMQAQTKEDMRKVTQAHSGAQTKIDASTNTQAFTGVHMHAPHDRCAHMHTMKDACMHACMIINECAYMCHHCYPT